jgi:uncharacterized LabA/DUF88 family protein
LCPIAARPVVAQGFAKSPPRLHSGQHPHNSISRQPPTSVASRRDAIKGGTHKLPENKVALFIDFDNIRIGIRQHFGGELHPQKLMNKASKYGRVTTAKAYADFTGHPKEFQDKLLFAAGIEPIHAPSKISGGRRQSSADMHMVIDMFLEAIDHEDVDTFILMTGDADFVRMVATLRRRFGRKVIISGVQSTSTSLDLMNAGDSRDPITKADVDMTGELGRMTRPLVTRADLDAQAAAEEAGRPAKRGGILGGLFRKKPAEPAGPAPAPRAIVAAPRIPAPAPAPRRMRASELRGSSQTRPSASPSSSSRGSTQSPPLGGRQRLAPDTVSRGRGRVEELPPVVAGTTPDEFETKLVREIASMPPGRSGYTTIKTIEETLRSKAGQLGGTRKEVPMRLQRLEAMGLFKRETRSRGTGSVETGELVMDHPLMANLIAGITPAAAPPPRLPRQPRPAPAPRPAIAAADSAAPEAVVETTAETAAPPAAEAEPIEAAVQEAFNSPMAEPEPASETPAAAKPAAAEPEPAAEPEAAAAKPEPVEATPFRWVTSMGTAEAEAPAATDEVAAKPKAKRAPRKSPAKPRTSSRAKKAAPAADTASEAAAEGGSEETESAEEQPAENPTDQTVPV